MKETTVPMISTIQRSEFMTTWRRRAGGAGGLAGMNLLEQIPAGGGDHGGNRKQKAELEGRGPVETHKLAGGDGGHGARGAGKDRRERLAEADPDGLGQVISSTCVVLGFVAVAPGVDDPHHDAADQQRHGHGVEAAQVLLAPLVQQQRGHRGDRQRR